VEVTVGEPEAITEECGKKSKVVLFYRIIEATRNVVFS
jgi:hypothetical protein